MNLLLMAVCALAPSQDISEIRDRIKDPAQVFPVFQELIAAGEYGTARNLLSPSAAKMLTPEIFYLTFASFEPPRRMVASLQVHALEPASNKLRLCSREFGVSRDFRI